MSEPTLSTLALSAVLGTATAATALLPGINGNALVGAMAGAALFVTSSHDLPLLRRAIYLVISTVAGYLAAPELLEDLPLHSVAVAAFLGGALSVTLTVQLIERAKSFDLCRLLKKGD